MRKHCLYSVNGDTPVTVSIGTTESKHANNWTEIATLIEGDEKAAFDQLCRLFTRGLRYYLMRELGFDTESQIRDILNIVLKATRNRDLERPDQLASVVRAAARRYVCSCADKTSHLDQKPIEDG